MSVAVQGLLNTFDCLSAEEQREVVTELIRRTRDMDFPPLDDETLARIADESFLEYDAREASEGGRESR